MLVKHVEKMIRQELRSHLGEETYLKYRVREDRTDLDRFINRLYSFSYANSIDGDTVIISNTELEIEYYSATVLNDVEGHDTIYVYIVNIGTYRESFENWKVENNE